MRLCFFLEPLEPRLSLSAGFISADGIPGGAITLDLDGHLPTMPRLALQPGGKIVVADYAYDEKGCRGRAYFLRFNRNGSRDLSFGDNGVTSLHCFPIEFDALLAQPDGKIIAQSIEGVYRLSADGQIDSTFNTFSKLPLPYSADDSSIGRIALAPDGRILVGGQAWLDYHKVVYGNIIPSNLALMRFNADGAPDPTFASSGALAREYSDPFGWVDSLVVQPDGKILLTTSDYADERDLNPATLLRFNADGTPDDTFAFHGQFRLTNHESPRTTLLQPDGKIIQVLTYYDDYPSPTRPILLRLNADGTPDQSFGHNGRATMPSDRYDDWTWSFLQSDGKIILIASDNIIARFNSDGTVDSTFGFGGWMALASADPQFEYWIDDAVLRPDGHLLLLLGKNNYVEEGYYDVFSEHLVDITTDATAPSRPFSADGNFIILAPDSPFLKERHFPTFQGDVSYETDQENEDNSATTEDLVWDDSQDSLDWEDPGVDSWLG
jgi:uncharacterized delta-60 repeat protein